MWAIGARWCTRASAGAWLLQPSGARAAGGVDGDLGAAVLVSRLRPHDEPIAGLAASMALVCGNGHHRSVIPAFDSSRNGTVDRREVRTSGGYAGMAQPTAVARAVIGVADIVGLVGISVGNKEAGGEPERGPIPSNAMARRDADRLGIGRESSRGVGDGGEVQSERVATQPTFGVAGDAIPGRNLFAVGFWTSVQRIAHRGRLWERATALAMLGSIT
jgi:hypothetical protein